MNALELICKMGVKGKNVPNTLDKIESNNDPIDLVLEKIRRLYKEMFSSLFSSWTYEDMVEVDGWGDGHNLNEYSIKDFFGLMVDGDLTDEEAEAYEADCQEVENFIALLQKLVEFEVSNIEVDFEKGIIYFE